MSGEASHHTNGGVSAVHGFLDTVREGHPSTPLLVVSMMTIWVCQSAIACTL